jgi:hypothetical protein
MALRLSALQARGRSTGTAQNFKKVFWFFFSKKNRLLPPPAPRAAQGPARSNVVIALQMPPRRGD